MQEKAYPHPLTFDVSNDNKTILRKQGDYNECHYVFGNKVFYKGKHIINMKLDHYKKYKYLQIRIGACFESTVQDLKEDSYYDSGY